jgi:hypothetical protein
VRWQRRKGVARHFSGSVPLRYDTKVGKIDQRYSMAARCPHCEHRAILTVAAANRLVSASKHRLESFACPIRHGWHLRYPGIENCGKGSRRGWR